ncbi:hypothetical protein ACHAWU_001002 [Discostella pseudostelligera]|uniref:Uncharacterized protein n=1 Tax=Discostella pseudostelligera TaxID=259834 RepID=A0ABD3MQU0_9STRA
MAVEHGDGKSNSKSHPMYYDEIHITDSGALITVSNDVNDMVSDSDDNEPNLSRHIAELASELLRLQEQGNSAEPRRTGVFSPESLRRWTREVPCDAPVTPLESPATPAPVVIPSPLDSLPTPTSTSDGRSDAADFLRDRIQKMQLHDESGAVSNAAANAAAAAENRIADFSHRSDYEQLRIEKGEAEAEAALLSAELITLRGRHEDEKRQLMKTVKDLRRWNEELESRMSLQRLDSKANNGTETATINNGRSRSGSSQTSVDDRDTKFGFRVRALAQRWTSPHPRSSPCTIDGDEEVSYPSSSDHPEFPRGISGGETTEGAEVLRSTIGDGDESQSTIASLQEQLRQSEHRAAVLEQRLAIVKESGDAVIQSLNEELADLADDRARSEAAMIKELSILDNQRREERRENEKRIQEWIAHDAHRKAEVEEYESRIKSLLETVRMMSEGVADCRIGTNSTSSDKDAENEVYDELIQYIQLLGKGSRSLISSINDAFDLEFNANPNVADNMLEYYRSRPELREFTLKSELPRMHYEVLVVDDETGKEMKLNSTDEIRSYFASLEKSNAEDDEVDILLRAANQSLLADPLGILSGEGDGRLVHSGRFHSTLIATDCSFKLDLRREGQRRVKVQCELAICVPSGSDGSIIAAAPSEEEGKEEKSSATLELARAILVIQFSPSPTSTPSGPLVKYALMDIKPTISDYEDGTDTARAIQSAAAVLARDRYSHIQCASPEVRPHVVKSRFFARVKQFSGRRGSGGSD